MTQKGNTGIYALIAVIVVAIIGLGVFFFTNNDDGDDVTVDTSQVQEQPSDTQNSEDADQASQNIVELAQATPSLSTLVDAVVAADLVETLSGPGPFTVLAPNDDAFADAIEALDTTAEELLAREDLADILKYHVISGEVMSSDLSNGQEVTTVAGGTLTVEITDGTVYFVDANGGKAMVLTPDVEASNGVVHIIDAVLLP